MNEAILGVEDDDLLVSWQGSHQPFDFIDRSEERRVGKEC